MFTPFFHNLQHTRWQLSSESLQRAKKSLNLTHFNKITLQFAIVMPHAAQYGSTKDSSTSFGTCNAAFSRISGCKMGCYT